jgi:predicted Zn-dependent protease
MKKTEDFRQRPSALGLASRLSLGLCMVLLTACGGFIGPQQELQLGAGVDKEIAKEYRLLADDDPVAVWARAFVKPMEQASNRHRNSGEFGGYKVKVIADDKLVNAFAAPGGYTYLSTGLILEADRCSDVAGVMGHELAHVTQKHGIQALEAQVATQTLASWFLGEGLAAEAAVAALGILQSTKFSRDNEAEADAVGLQIAHDAGYNPYGLARFFEALLALEKKSGGSSGGFLASHPATADRVRDVSAAIRKRYGNAVKRDDPPRDACQKTALNFAAVQDRIRKKQLKFAPKGVAMADLRGLH